MGPRYKREPVMTMAERVTELRALRNVVERMRAISDYLQLTASGSDASGGGAGGGTLKLEAEKDNLVSIATTYARLDVQLLRGAEAATAGSPIPMLTFMNNIGTGEGPDAVDQYAVAELSRFSRTMRVDRKGGRLLVHDKLHGRDVEVFCAHFSGSAKVYLTEEWLERNFGIRV